jgi:hypothetical protein
VTAQDLYGRAQVVGLVKNALKRTGVPGQPLPIVLLVGPRGAGGTALLGRLWAQFGGDALGAHLDLEAAQGIDDIVLAVLQGMHRRLLGIRQIRFSRLGLAVKALSFVDDGGGGRAAFDAYMKSSSSSAAAAALDAWSGRALPLLRSLDQQLLASLAVQLAAWALSIIDDARKSRPVAWFAANGISGGGAKYDPLWELYRWRHERSAASARKVDATLCAALLEDLRGDFNESGLWHGQRPSNCLLLLDNAGDGPGADFLRLIEERRRQDEAAGRPGDPLLVVAVHRGEPPVRGRRWQTVGLADLSLDDIDGMTTSSVLGTARLDTDFVHELTGGHPQAARLLVTLLDRFGRAEEAFDARTLLARALPAAKPNDPWPGEEAGTAVEDFLLKRVFAEESRPRPDDAGGNPRLDALAVCAATPGLRLGACQAAFRFLGWTELNAVDEYDRLKAGLWLAEGSGGQRPHPLVALLLRRWLARDPETWRLVHQGYAAHYSRPGDAVLRQHHTLALVEPSHPEQLASVVAYLDAERDKLAAHKWIGVLDEIVSAPNRLSTDRDPGSFIATLAGTDVPGDRRRVIARLAVACWLYNDRCFDPHRRLAPLISEQYAHLAGLSGLDGEAFFTESRKWRRVERGGEH